MLDDSTSPLRGSRLLRPMLGAVVCAVTIGLLTGPVSAESTAQGTLPLVTISTTSPMQTTGLDVLSDGTGVTADLPVASQPAKHQTHHVRMQTVDTTSLSPSLAQAGSGTPIHAVVPMVMEARATTLRPAPLPDQDMDAPGPNAQALAAQQQASVTPSFYGHSDHFSGDGFAAGSNLEGDENNRRRPGGGMSLSIPVQ